MCCGPKACNGVVHDFSLCIGSVLLLKGDMNLERFLQEMEANKRKPLGAGDGGDEWWDEGVAEAVS